MTADLIHQLEQAQSGSRELSDAVLKACGWEIKTTLNGIWWIGPENQSIPIKYSPSPTESLDDALQLVPEGWDWGIARMTVEGIVGFECRLCDRRVDPDSVVYWADAGAAAPLSLCIALLKALSQQKAGEEVG